MVTARLAGN